MSYVGKHTVSEGKQTDSPRRNKCVESRRPRSIPATSRYNSRGSVTLGANARWRRRCVRQNNHALSANRQRRHLKTWPLHIRKMLWIATCNATRRTRKLTSWQMLKNKQSLFDGLHLCKHTHAHSRICTHVHMHTQKYIIYTCI